MFPFCPLIHSSIGVGHYKPYWHDVTGERRFSMKLGTYTIFDMLSSKIIVGRAVGKGVGHHLATVAKNEKIQFPTTNSNETRYAYYIWYAESENLRWKKRWPIGKTRESDYFFRQPMENLPNSSSLAIS